MNEYDLIVIGAGSGGLVAATSGNRSGLKTALVEKNKIGGECTHYGCVPSKALINATKPLHLAANGANLGYTISTSDVDFGFIMGKVDEIVQGVYKNEMPEVFQDQGIDTFVHNSGAKFIDSHTIKIGERILQGKNFVICTGSSPRLPQIQGIENVPLLHNENFWELRKGPDRIVFIGGGVISVELGQSLARLGCEVSIVDRNSRLLKVADEEIGLLLTEQLSNEGVKFYLNSKPIRFNDENTLVIQQEGREIELVADNFFVASGRSPNYKALDLDNAGIIYSDHGIEVNDFLQTSQPHIYACGDVTTKYKFTHTASYQAEVSIQNIVNGNIKKNDLSVLPWAVFTDPEVGHVGLSLEEAKTKYGSENISVFKVDANIDRFVTDRSTGGFLKVIFDQNDLVIGAEAIGKHAGEWIQLLTLAMKNSIPAHQMADTIFIYPTYSEIVKKAFSRFLRSKHL